MSHWHNWHHRGPSRFVWFMIGAFSATWYLKHCKNHWNHRVGCSRPDLPAESYSQQPQYIPPPQQHSTKPYQPNPEGEKVAASPSREWRRGWGSPPAPPTPTPPVDHGWDEEAQRRWAEEKQQKRQAADTFVDFSESTLDTVMSAVESLKAKLAEHRSNRERQIGEWQAWREEQIKQLEEWKKQQAEAAQMHMPPPSPGSPRRSV
ncbi:hypothetical protein EUX98_g6721 [Antrodiella citrinella]|uniref:Uncharacterized protein n=1 Tax=Antrodiella citrinella TaxID=2447956 RepID=A0A4S4MNF7_9APHY|nr:hypothetical protein EUX98_g6721 [Antrodiella citrinella]